MPRHGEIPGIGDEECLDVKPTEAIDKRSNTKEENSPLESLKKEVRDLKNSKEVMYFFEVAVPDFLKTLEEIRLEADRDGQRPEKSFERLELAANRVAAEGEALIRKIPNRLLTKRIKKCFRELVGPVFYEKGTLLERAYRKPMGYPGDYQTIEMFYKNQSSYGGFKKLCDDYVLRQDYVQAVRERKDFMKAFLKDYLKRHGSRDLSLLNLGSGSCRELRETPRKILGGAKSLKISLLDQDQGSLEFCRDELHRLHPAVQFRTIAANVLDYARHADKYKKMLGQLDLIYCIGLADYIHDACLQGIAATSFGLLRPGGTFTIAHKNVLRHPSIPSDWFSDWSFIPRDEKEFESLLRSSLSNVDYELRLDQVGEGHVFYITITKGCSRK